MGFIENGCNSFSKGAICMLGNTILMWFIALGVLSFDAASLEMCLEAVGDVLSSLVISEHLDLFSKLCLNKCLIPLECIIYLILGPQQIDSPEA